MQTKTGKLARGITSHEFTEVMEKISDKANEPENLLHLGRNEEWKYSWDNDRVHKGADLSEVCITAEQRYYLPELSSDMHGVVEHCHAFLQARMLKWLEQQDRKTLTVDTCKTELERIFYNELSIESIQKDVEALTDTYEAIVLNNGGYVTKRCR